MTYCLLMSQIFFPTDSLPHQRLETVGKSILSQFKSKIMILILGPKFLNDNSPNISYKPKISEIKFFNMTKKYSNE